MRKISIAKILQNFYFFLRILDKTQVNWILIKLLRFIFTIKILVVDLSVKILH